MLPSSKSTALALLAIRSCECCELAALRTAIMAPDWAKNTVSQKFGAGRTPMDMMGPGQVQRYFEPPADDGKMLAKRFARGGIRTRDLQHGADGASYHYTTPPHSVFFWRSRSARDQNRNSEKAERCRLSRATRRDKDHEIWLR